MSEYEKIKELLHNMGILYRERGGEVAPTHGTIRRAGYEESKSIEVGSNSDIILHFQNTGELIGQVDSDGAFYAAEHIKRKRGLLKSDDAKELDAAQADTEEMNTSWINSENYDSTSEVLTQEEKEEDNTNTNNTQSYISNTMTPEERDEIYKKWRKLLK